MTTGRVNGGQECLSRRGFCSLVTRYSIETFLSEEASTVRRVSSSSSTGWTMPESKTDQAHRTIEEISNYHDCGDARGRVWLDSHPDAREKADEALRAQLAEDAGSPPQQRLSSTD
ncbi:hypothetical protein acdb102_30490 [Acidothermaceae bacterium B102]|nr:hypothetical protein acdb102_30490 [Acidothermaceae bacterium B102]